MKQKKSNLDYLWYALYAFLGLGFEVVLVLFLEPLIFNGRVAQNYSNIQRITHWLLTILCWGIIALILYRSAKKNLSFHIISKDKPTTKGIIISIILVALCIGINVFDWGPLKIIAEFQKKGTFLFVFQYIYYIFEVILVYLIIVFGQRFFDGIVSEKRRLASLPWVESYYVALGERYISLPEVAFWMV